MRYKSPKESRRGHISGTVELFSANSAERAARWNKLDLNSVAHGQKTMVKAALAVPVARTGRSGVLEPGQVPAVSNIGSVSVCNVPR